MNDVEQRAAADELAHTAAAYRASMHRTAARILGYGDAARDAVQEALITLWLNPPERAIASRCGWVHSVDLAQHERWRGVT